MIDNLKRTKFSKNTIHPVWTMGLNIATTVKEIEFIIEKLTGMKSPIADGFTGEFAKC